jgi:hypothetical protein
MSSYTFYPTRKKIRRKIDVIIIIVVILAAQQGKHYEMLSQQLEERAQDQDGTDLLKKEIETRSQVLRDQSLQQKLLAMGGSASSGGNGSGVGALVVVTGMAFHPPVPTINGRMQQQQQQQQQQ